MPDRHIIAIGGLLADDDNACLIDYALGLSNVPRPSLGYLATASGDAQDYRDRFDGLASGLTCEPSQLRLFHRTPDIDEWIAAQDVILVGGGNTKSMLAVWREWNLPSLLWAAWERGTILMGWSAGAICWFEQGVTDSWSDRLKPLDCLGLLPGSCCPHYSKEPERKPAYQELVTSGQIAPGIAIDDGVGVHFIGRTLHAVVTSASGAGAYNVRLNNGRIVESPLDVPCRNTSTSSG